MISTISHPESMVPWSTKGHQARPKLCDNIKNVFSQEWLFALTNYKESDKNCLFNYHPGPRLATTCIL